ncbi:hypothetical protein FPZ43_08910 [Mucilaginibacter pallidiroseus]|uniref:MafI family immunity protein n=1 Tax=Mucilaginibacter pallidiroseus TaxID=2599295 RepID=A0A563UFC3_9SPHI|nr:hypothetical protein [Mucilaginibacter pallidiroseus]TWR29959.1 hypothetical protein FPZ43_08910 [Mucilaginibacter pallidiroseus]
MFDYKVKAHLNSIIDRAASYGLTSVDVDYATDFLAAHEFLLCLDHIVTQLFEYNISVDDQFFIDIEHVAHIVGMPEDDYSHIKSLIKHIQ